MALALLVSAVPAGAQRPDVVRTFGGPGTDVGNAVVALPGGGYAVLGYSDGPDGHQRDAWLLRLNEALDTLWTRRYGGPGEDHGWDLAPTPQGGFVLVGFRQMPGGDEDVWVARTDSVGLMVWERTFGGPGRERAWAVTLLDGGDALVLAETTSLGAGAEDVLLIRIDPRGDTVWTRHAGGPGTDRAFALARLGQGALFVGLSATHEPGLRVLLGRVEPDGRIRLERRSGGAGSDVGHGIARLPGGDFLVTGYSGPGPGAANNVMLLRLDPDGREISRMLVDAAGEERAMMSAVAPDGRTATVGYTLREGDWDVLLYQGRPGEPGGMRWTDRIPGDGRGIMAAPTAAGGWVVTGVLASPDDPGQLMVLKVPGR